MRTKAGPNAPSPKLAEASKLRGEGSYSSIARMRARATGAEGKKIRALLEATYFAGPRKAGVPED
jgi:hypothetical protein